MGTTYIQRQHIFDVNRRVVIVIPEGPYSGRYPSRIEGTGKMLVLAAPTHKGVRAICAVKKAHSNAGLKGG